MQNPLKNEGQCSICQSYFTYKNKPRQTCSKECRRKLSSQKLSEYNRQYASERMKANNPMQSEKTKNKMIESLKRINHKPILQGGNGRGLTYAQKSLLEELGEGWYPEFVVKTKQVRNLFEKKPPNHYKIDIANPILKIAIEIDGHSHCTPSRKEQDFRKTKSLEFMGWTTLRFTNKQIKENPKQCLDIVLKSTESPTEETR